MCACMDGIRIPPPPSASIAIRKPLDRHRVGLQETVHAGGGGPPSAYGALLARRERQDPPGT
jgi:hypothetical protein